MFFTSSLPGRPTWRTLTLSRVSRERDCRRTTETGIHLLQQILQTWSPESLGHMHKWARAGGEVGGLYPLLYIFLSGQRPMFRLGVRLDSTKPDENKCNFMIFSRSEAQFATRLSMNNMVLDKNSWCLDHR